MRGERSRIIPSFHHSIIPSFHHSTTPPLHCLQFPCPKFAVNLSKYPMPWRCNHCGEAGYVLDENYVQNLTIKPILTTTVWNELSEPILKFFTDRKISKETI